MPRVLVVDDSASSRRLLTHILASDPDITVAGEATNGAEAVRMTARLAPDLVTMDVQMPVMDGFEATRRIMRETPTPIVMISAVQPDEVAWSFKALEAGALTVLAKPAGPKSPQFESQSGAIVRTVKELSMVRVVTRRVPTLRLPAAAATPARPGGSRPEVSVVAIGASTGGPAALAAIVSKLAPGFPVPVLVVQHIGGGFDRGLVDWLNGVARVRVTMAMQGKQLAPATVYVAPHDRHLGVSRSGRILLSDGPPIGGHRPSATHLFRSVAAAYGPNAVGVILTGIGADGCEGLQTLRQAGGTVLAQDRESSVVYGMPGAVVDAGIADRVLALGAMADAIEELVQPDAPGARPRTAEGGR
jgi:two-component system, chemotaxis family, protein-glutamate methylesterase/glutaminase